MPGLFKNRRCWHKKIKTAESQPLVHSNNCTFPQSSSSQLVPEVMSGNLVIPIAVWGKSPITHCVSSILMTPDQSHIVTGCHDGHLSIWLCEDNLKVSPQMILFGHTSPVTCLAMASSDEQNCVVSSSDNGEMCLWDLSDGRCMEHNKMTVVHTHIQSHQLLQNREIRLICNGFYPEIFIMHPKQLEVLITLSSNVQPDWISALCILRPINKEEVVVAVTNSGLAKVWTIPAIHGNQQGIQIFENESKQTRCLNAKILKCCIYNQRTVLIVCTKYWQIYDASDFSVLCSESSRIGERWMGGEFISASQVIVWSNRGRGYLYQLPSNTNPNSISYRSSEQNLSAPMPYLMFDLPCDKPLDCSPVMTYIMKRREGDNKLLLRGDSMGRICAWIVSAKENSTMGTSFEAQNLKVIKQTSFENLPVMKPSGIVTWCDEWKNSTPHSEGILDHLDDGTSPGVQVTSTVFMSSCCHLACGRSDGSIIIMSATQAVSRQLFENSGDNGDALPHKSLVGHRGRVNCLLYPHNESNRYSPDHLVSGGQDFCVLLWDVARGTKLFCFCVHGGEILQLIVPPENCNPRVLSSVCAIASDHSLSLLSLRDRKCVLLASRQLFPIQVVKWRPHDDFVVVGCTDGTVYVWQMETGHLDRVVHGVAADDILSACDEKSDTMEKLSNPTVTVTQALRRHNMATFKHLAQQHLKKAQDAMEQKSSSNKAPHPSLIQKTQSLLPMVVHGLRSNPKDSESHVVYFNAEALIVQLLSEEYSSLSPNTLENLGFYTKVLQDQGLSETQKIFVDIFSKVRNKADDVSKKIQSKVDAAAKTSSSQTLASTNPSSDSLGTGRPDPPTTLEKSQGNLGEQDLGCSSTLAICQILMSCLHAWELEPDVDKLCLSKLGLLKPKRTISFGYLSPGGHMSLSLPCARHHVCSISSVSKKQETIQERFVQSSKNPFFQGLKVGEEPDVVVEKLVDVKIHWQISSAVTTQHLLSIISLTNTLMSMSNATFIKSRQTSKNVPSKKSGSFEENVFDAIADINSTLQAQNKQGWSLLAALHCVLLPDLVGRMKFKPPQLEMLARRWQDRCLEIREASQALLLAELRRLGPEGRSAVVDEWSHHLPAQTDSPLTFVTPEIHPGSQVGAIAPSRGIQYGVPDEEEEDDDDGTIDGNEYLTSGSQVQRSTSFQQHSKHATAIVMMGVIGAEFGVSVDGQRSRESSKAGSSSNGAAAEDGFSVGNCSHARHTSKALASLLLQPFSHGVSSYSLIRRAAVDLLGRGFVVWEPYLDVSSILIGLLELCIDAEKLVPSMTFGLPLTPRADACRTSRHALALVATARPATFVITMAKEVARYNAMTQNAQSQHYHHSVHAAVLMKAKPEIVKVLELLIDKHTIDLVDHLSELTDIIIHCMDLNQVKATGLQDAFPLYCKKFPMISYCHSTRRIAVGTKTGNLLFYDLKQGKCQTIHAHGGSIQAATFAPDGKYLASYSLSDNKLLLWQTAASSLFSLGSHQIKCFKSFTTHSVQLSPTINLLKNISLSWHDNRTVGLQLWDAMESRFRL